MKKAQKEKPLDIYYSERWKVFSMHLDNTIKHLGEEDLHQLRVEIKKMRALIRMLELATDGEFIQKRYEKPLTRIFKPGGKLRETHINRNLALKYDFQITPVFVSHQDTLAIKYIDKLLRSLEKFTNEETKIFKKEFPNLIKSLNKKHMLTAARQFLVDEFKAIKKLFKNAEGAKEIHKIRMHLKASGYILKLLLDLDKADSERNYYNEIKAIESIIGNWHDLIVFRKSLLKFSGQYGKKVDINPVKKAIEKVDYDIETAAQEISRQLAKLVKYQLALN